MRQRVAVPAAKVALYAATVISEISECYSERENKR